jgi:hypothetical protein
MFKPPLGFSSLQSLGSVLSWDFPMPFFLPQVNSSQTEFCVTTNVNLLPRGKQGKQFRGLLDALAGNFGKIQIAGREQ